jgi:hypothetical protein
LHKIEQARHRDVETFADALGSFGLVEIAVMAQQATNRMRFLDHFEELIRNKDTHEMTVHKALENSLWALGEEYSVVTSNKTLARTIEEQLNKKFKGERAQKRPDLLLADLSRDKMLLI